LPSDILVNNAGAGRSKYGQGPRGGDTSAAT
jgi:hypothetical protein